MERQAFGSDGGGSNGNDHLIAEPTPSVLAVPEEVCAPKGDKEAPSPVVASVFKAEKFLRSHEEEFLCRLWVSLRERLASTSPNLISSLKDEVMLVLESMKRFEHADVFLIEEFLEALFTKAAAYDEARSTAADMPTKEVLAKQLKDAKSRLQKALDRETEEARQVKASEAKLKSIEEQLDLLTRQRDELSTSLLRQKESLREAAAEVGELHGEIVAIQSTEPSDDVAEEALRFAEENLIASKDVLESLNPFS